MARSSVVRCGLDDADPWSEALFTGSVLGVAGVVVSALGSMAVNLLS